MTTVTQLKIGKYRTGIVDLKEALKVKSLGIVPSKSKLKVLLKEVKDSENLL